MHALQALFEIDETDHAPERVIAHHVDAHLLDAEVERFLRHLVLGAWGQRQYLDQVIGSVASSWPIQQMPGVEKAILRIAVFELLVADREHTPVPVAIDEAVELAKQFGGDHSSRFINGVLGTIVTRYLESSRRDDASSIAP
jgi:N utilization substance protein B